MKQGKRGYVAVSLSVAVLGVAGGVVAAVPANAANCSDVEVVFARGTLDPGIVGTPFSGAVTEKLAGKTVTRYDVDYAADPLQLGAGAGATDMTRHVISVAKSCPGTTFVLGGYSQGASVVDIAIGIDTVLGKGETIPEELAPRVAAVVVFGNPLALTGGHIPTDSLLYGAKSKEFCNDGDPVCTGGSDTLAHLAYATDGSVTDGGAFAVGKVLGD